MIVVSDTSPINYLLEIGHIAVLPKLFGKIFIPTAVFAELKSEGAPARNLEWLQNLPSAFEVRSASQIDAGVDLDAGEREAISLAVELRADAILVDDRKGRRLARLRGLAVVGTIGILEKAGEAGLLDAEAALRTLQRTTFFAPEELIEAAIARVSRKA